MLLVVICFLSRGFQVGVYFLALCFRGFSPCVLVDFPGLGAAGFVCSRGRLLSGCSFHFRAGVNASWCFIHNPASHCRSLCRLCHQYRETNHKLLIFLSSVRVTAVDRCNVKGTLQELCRGARNVTCQPNLVCTPMWSSITNG